MARAKPIYQISSQNQNNNTSSGKGISFIAPERPKYVPVSNAMSLGGVQTEIKKTNPSEYKISSSNPKCRNLSKHLR